MTTLAQGLSPDTRVDSVECQQTPEEQRAQGKLGLSKETRRGISAVALSVTMALAGCNSDGKVEKTSAQTPASSEVKTQMVQTEAQKPLVSGITEGLEGLAKIEGSTLPVSLIELSKRHAQDVASGKVLGGKPILSFVTLYPETASREDKLNFIANALSLAPEKSAKELGLQKLEIIKKTINNVAIDSIDEKVFNTNATLLSDTKDIKIWLQTWAPEPENRKPATVEEISAHEKSIKEIEQVWLTNVQKWDSEIATGKLQSNFYQDLTKYFNTSLEKNQYPSTESFRVALTSAIEMARANNLPDSVLGQKMYDFGVGKIAYATSVYGVLTGEKTPVVKIQIGEVKYSLAAVGNTTSDKAHQSIPDFVAKLQTEQYEKLVTAGNSKYTSVIAAEKLAKTEAEGEKIQAELAQEKAELARANVEGKFIEEATKVQADMYARLQEYIKNPNEETLGNIKELYVQLQDLNKRFDTEFSDQRVKQALLALTQMCKEKIPQLASVDQGKNLVSTI